MKTLGLAVLGSAFLLAGSTVRAQEKTDHCAGMSDHHAQADARGDKVMGFDHAKTTHHFLLSAAGGAIEVTANSGDDKESRDAIRGHLGHIAKMFSDGNFEAPMLVHDRVPPGVDAMKKNTAGIQWKYEEIEDGARIVAITRDPEALSAIHEFLRFQIADHRTGDPGTVKKN